MLQNIVERRQLLGRVRAAKTGATEQPGQKLAQIAFIPNRVPIDKLPSDREPTTWAGKIVVERRLCKPDAYGAHRNIGREQRSDNGARGSPRDIRDADFLLLCNSSIASTKAARNGIFAAPP